MATIKEEQARRDTLVKTELARLKEEVARDMAARVRRVANIPQDRWDEAVRADEGDDAPA